MKLLERRKRRAFFFIAHKHIYRLSALRRGAFFFCRRAVWSGGFFHFTFPWPGGCGSYATKTPKGATYGQQKYESGQRQR